MNLSKGKSITMIKRKTVKEKGKLSLSKYFQEFKIGDKVAVIRDRALNPGFPERIQGRTGEGRGHERLARYPGTR